MIKVVPPSHETTSFWDEANSIFEREFEVALQLAEQNPERAAGQFERCFTFATTIGSKQFLAKAHKAYCDFCETIGESELAEEHRNTYRTLYVEIYNESEGRLKLLSTYIKLLRETTEKDFLRQQNELLDRQLNQYAVNLATQSELLSNFREDLRRIIREIDEPIAALKKIKEKLKDLPCESVDWLKFEKQFVSVHPEFRTKLMETFPALSKQEVKMCQLARLGLKTHEMGRLLCLSSRTIDGHRNNLRKKMGLKPNDNLTKYLQSV